MSDRLALANAIEDAGIERAKAERVASVIVDLVHEDRALLRQFVHHVAVMDDLAANVDGRAEGLESDLHDVDGAHDAGAKTAAQSATPRPITCSRWPDSATSASPLSSTRACSPSDTCTRPRSGTTIVAGNAWPCSPHPRP